ncbi:MAG: tetratricopeptide repeat protein, partial [Bacteroidota bacterium]
MLKRLLLCLISVWTYGNAYAGTPELDSLTRVLQEQAPDSHRVKTLLKLGRETFNSDSERSMEWYREAWELADRIGYVKGRARAEIQQSLLYRRFGVMDRSKVMAIASVKSYYEIGDSVSAGISETMVAVLDFRIGNYQKAAASYRKLEAFFLRNGEEYQAVVVRHNMGSVLTDLGRVDEALANYRANLAYGREKNKTRLLAATLNNLGNIHKKAGRYDSAMIYLEESLVQKKKLGDREYLASSYSNIGETMTKMGRFREARTYLEKSEAIAREGGGLDQLSKAMKDWSFYYEKTGQYRRALEALQTNVMLSDSMYNIDIARVGEEIQAVYESEKQTAEIELLNVEREAMEKEKAAAEAAQEASEANSALKNWLLLAMSLGLIAVVGLFFVVQRNNQKVRNQRRQIASQNNELAEKNGRLAELNMEKDELIRIVAHDIRAPLNRSA